MLDHGEVARHIFAGGHPDRVQPAVPDLIRREGSGQSASLVNQCADLGFGDGAFRDGLPIVSRAPFQAIRLSRTLPRRPLRTAVACRIWESSSAMTSSRLIVGSLAFILLNMLLLRVVPAIAGLVVKALRIGFAGRGCLVETIGARMGLTSGHQQHWNAPNQQSVTAPPVGAVITWGLFAEAHDGDFASGARDTRGQNRIDAGKGPFLTRPLAHPPRPSFLPLSPPDRLTGVGNG